MKDRRELDAGVPDYAARLDENIRYLADFTKWPIKRIASNAGIAYQTLQNWRTGAAPPTLWKLQDLADVLGVDATDLLLPHEELVVKVQAEGLRPFVLRPAASPSSLSSTSLGSGASGAKTRDRFGKIKGKSTSRREGNARFTQPDSDLREAA